MQVADIPGAFGVGNVMEVADIFDVGRNGILLFNINYL
jgi:hypothetical protein